MLSIFRKSLPETSVSRLTAPGKKVSGFRRAISQYARDPLSNVGAAILTVIVVVAIIAPVLTSSDPVKVNYGARFVAPNSDYLFGTDHLGRDIFARVVYGTRLSLLVAVVVSLISGGIGLVLGGLAGYLGGMMDEVIMRITDVFLSFPWLLFAMSIALVLGPNLWNSMIALAFVWWPGYARLVRGQVLMLKSHDFVEAAQSMGSSHFRILFRHILPNSLGPYMVLLTIGAGRVIIATSTLSFIGLGAQPPTPEWGVMIADGRTALFDAWWISTFPGLAILFTTIGFNLVGDGLRDMLDPRMSVR